MLLAGAGHHQTGSKADTVVVETQYGIEFTHIWILPKFLSGLVGGAAQWLKAAPKGLNYKETVVDPKSADDYFCMDVLSQNGKEWVRAVSDTTQLSFIDPSELPNNRLKRDSLRADVIRFLAALREYFRDPKAVWQTGTFRLWTDTLNFYVFRDTAAETDAAYGKYRPCPYELRAFNLQGKPFIKGRFLAGSKDGFVVYPMLDLYIYENKVGIVLKIKNIVIDHRNPSP